MTLQTTTEILILSTIVIWIAWDVYAYRKGGNLPTESWFFKKWAYYIPGIACLFGILMGHFFFGYPPPEQLCPIGQQPVPTQIHIGVPKPISTPNPVVVPIKGTK